MPQPVIAEISPAGGVVGPVCLLAVGDRIGVAGDLRPGAVIPWALIRIDGIRLGGIGLGGVIALVLLA